MKTQWNKCLCLGMMVFGIGLMWVNQSDAQIFGGRFRIFARGNSSDCYRSNMNYNRFATNSQYGVDGYGPVMASTNANWDNSQSYISEQGSMNGISRADGNDLSASNSGQIQMNNSILPDAPLDSQSYSGYSSDQQRSGTSSDGQRFSDNANSTQSVAADQELGRQSSSPQDETLAMNQFLASKLILCNNEVIKMSQIAAKKSTNQGVKDFAATLVQQHQQLNQKLQPFKASYAEQAMVVDAKNSGDAATLVAGDNVEPKNLRETGFRQNADTVYSEMFALCRKVSQYKREHCERMMSQASAEDYDMAFVGGQIAGHQMLSAELQAIAESSEGEFQSMVRQARQSVDSHLEKATQLAKQLKSSPSIKTTDR